MDKNRTYNRRYFISSLGKASIGGLIIPSPFYSFAVAQNEERIAAVDPITAVTIAKTSLDLISAFSGSKDSAMAAMMRYQISLLQNIIQQLSAVQAKLVEIQNAIQDLPDQFRQSLEQQFKIELITDVQSAAYRYTTNVLIPSLNNPSIIQNPEVKSEINNILFIADQKISTLALMEGGIGPQACMIAPLAMSLNIACRTSLKYPNEVIISSLLRYQRWFDDMLSDRKGSISDYLNQSAKTHDNAFDQLKDDHLAKRLQIENFKLNGSQKGAIETDPGIIFHVFGPNQIEGLQIDNKGGTRQGQNLASTARAIFRVNANLYTFDDATLGGKLIGYKRSSSRIYSKDDQFNWQYFTPKNGEYYYIQKIDITGKYPANKLINLVNNGQTSAKTDDVSRAKLNLGIAEANLERAKMCFCAQANIVALNSKKRIIEYLNLLR